MTELINVLHPAIENVDTLNHTNRLPILSGVNYSRAETVVASSKSTSAINFSITPPSNTAIDRNINLRLKVKVTGTSSTPANAKAACDSIKELRAYPLSNVIQNANLTLNGTTLSHSVAELQNGLQYVNNDVEVRRKNGKGPNLVPLYQSTTEDYLVQNVGAELGAANANYLGLNSSSVTDYLSSARDGTSGEFTVDLVEPLSMPILSKSLGHGLANVTQLDIQLTLTSLFNLFKNSGTLGAPAVTFSVEEASVQVYYYSINETIPDQIVMPFHNLVHFKEDLGTIQTTSRTVGQKTLSNFKLNSVPEYIMIFASPTNSAKSTDLGVNETTLPIENVKLTINNNGNLLDAMTVDNLYDMAVSNGLSMPHFQYKKNSSVFLARVNKDVNVNDIIAGSNTLFNCQPTITFGDMNQVVNTSMEVHIVFFQPTRAIISENNCELQIGYSNNDIVTALESEEHPMKFSDLDVNGHHQLVGGGWFNTLYNGARKVYNVGKKIVESDLGKAAISAGKEFLGAGDVVVGGADMRIGGSHTSDVMHKKRF